MPAAMGMRSITRVPIAVLTGHGGRFVHELINTEMEPGSHTIDWNGQDVCGNTIAAGVYFCTLMIDDTEYVEKIVHVK